MDGSADSNETLALAIKRAFGEIYGQLVIDFTWSDVNEGDVCKFSVEYHRAEEASVKTTPFSEITFKQVGLTLFMMIFLIVLAIILLILIILLRHLVGARGGRVGLTPSLPLVSVGLVAFLSSK